MPQLAAVAVDLVLIMPYVSSVFAPLFIVSSVAIMVVILRHHAACSRQNRQHQASQNAFHAESSWETQLLTGYKPAVCSMVAKKSRKKITKCRQHAGKLPARDSPCPSSILPAKQSDFIGYNRIASSMRNQSNWIARFGATLFALALLYPLTALLARVGPWQWGPDFRGPALASVRVSLLLTTAAMLIIVAVGTSVAAYIARCSTRERLWWQALLLIPILLPPLALGILLSLAFGPYGAVGSALQQMGLRTTNSPEAFILTQVYVGMGYYVLGAIAAFDAVPAILQKQAALLGLSPMKVFFRVTLPLSRLGLAVALSIAWVRTIGEFGAVLVTAYYPAGMPVQLWTNLQSFGLPAVMPLLIIFLSVALPAPWLIHVLAQRKRHA
jgi:molybdate/tungstate transport system permease protein